MPIDDTLKKIKSTSQKESVQKSLFLPALINQGHEILGDYLVKEIFSAYKSYIPFLKTFGSYLILISPVRDRNNYRSTCTQEFSLVEKIEKEILTECFKKLGSLYINDTDLATISEGEFDLVSDGPKYLPEFSKIKSLLSNINLFEHTHPYVLSMGMQPRYRAIIALAIKESIPLMKKPLPSKNRKKKKRKSYYDPWKGNKDDLFMNVPNLESISNVAQKFGITELKDIIQDLNRVVADYDKKWD